MAKTATMTLRLDPVVKSESEALFSSFGMTLSEAITIFLNKSIMERGLPFEVKQPVLTKDEYAQIMGERLERMLTGEAKEHTLREV